MSVAFSGNFYFFLRTAATCASFKSFLNLAGLLTFIDNITDVLEKKAEFLRMFVFISNFLEAFFGSNFSVNILITSVLVSLNLNILDLF